MRIKTGYILALVAYLSVIAAFAGADSDAAVIFAILAPAAALFVLAAIWNKHLTLTLFALFFFVANGISPAFFFFEREIYSYSGWGAVGNFDFKVASYLHVALPVFGLMAVITTVCLLTTRAAYRAAPVRPIPERRGTRLEPVVQSESPRSNSPRTSLALLAFVFLVAIPLSLFMFNKGIGLVGVDNRTRLPFRLSGILYYARYFLVPVLLFYLYAKSSRSVLLAAAVLIYAGVAGVSSVSRSLLILSAVSVPVYAFLDRKYARLLISIGVMLTLYAVVTAARAFVYSFESLNAYALLMGSQFPTLETVGAIASRLGGAQDNVLAYQYVFPNRGHGIINFFLGRPIIENYALELYGFNLPEGMAFGVGFTLFPALLMLTGGDWILTVFIGTIVGLVLVVFEKLVRGYLSLGVPQFTLSAYPLAFLLVFTLFGANFRPLFFFLTVSILAIAAYHLIESARRQGAPMTRELTPHPRGG